MINFWEILTGNINDRRAKIIRYFVFTVLFFGIIFSGTKFFQAANVREDFEVPASLSSSQSSKELDEFLTSARKLEAFKRGGNGLASSLGEMRKRLFNDDFSEFESEGEGENFSVSLEELPNISVRAVMLSGKSGRAVVDVSGDRGIIVRNGSVLPGGGQVVKILRGGVRVRVKGREVFYPVR